MIVYVDNLKKIPDTIEVAMMALDNAFLTAQLLNIPKDCQSTGIETISGEILSIENYLEAIKGLLNSTIESFAAVEQQNSAMTKLITAYIDGNINSMNLENNNDQTLEELIYGDFMIDYEKIKNFDDKIYVGEIKIYGDGGKLLVEADVYTKTGTTLADEIASVLNGKTLVEPPADGYGGGRNTETPPVSVPSSPEIQGPSENENPVNEKLVNVQEKIMNYAKYHPELGLTEGEVRQAISKIHIMNSDDEFKSLLQQNGIQNTERVTEFINPISGKVYLPPDSSEHTITYALVYILGNKGLLNGINGENGLSYDGRDEAITESIVSQIEETKKSGLSSYSNNVKALDDIKQILDNAGYDTSSILGKSYYMSNSGLLAKTLNDIMGDETFYSELEKNMNIASGRGDVTDQTEISQAKVRVEALVQSLKDKLEKK